MSRAIVFVHGTGVRGEAYSRSFAQIRNALLEFDEDIQLGGCYWGDPHGARLTADGASIPNYADSGGSPPSEAERDLAQWAVLYTDPWYELRLLRFSPGGARNLAPGTLPPAKRLRQQLESFIRSAELRAALRLYDLDRAFDAAQAALLSAPEFDEAAATANQNLLEHRRAIARALLAHCLANTGDDTGSVIDGAARDALVERITNELDGYGRGVSDWVARSFKGLASRAVTKRVGRARGSVTDAAAPAAGDILRYQARGGGIRAAIRQSVVDTRADHVTLLAHSLGGIACVDLLALEHVPRVDRLITVGSQAPFLYEIGALVSLEPPAPLPEHFPRWLNIYDPRDFLGYVGASVFPGGIVDVEVDNGQPFPQAHSAYWSNRNVWAAIRDFPA